MTVAYWDTQRLWNYWAIPQNATVIDWAFLRRANKDVRRGVFHQRPSTPAPNSEIVGKISDYALKN